MLFYMYGGPYEGKILDYVPSGYQKIDIGASIPLCAHKDSNLDLDNSDEIYRLRELVCRLMGNILADERRLALKDRYIKK